jgi:hypothetical protein
MFCLSIAVVVHLKLLLAISPIARRPISAARTALLLTRWKHAAFIHELVRAAP